MESEPSSSISPSKYSVLQEDDDNDEDIYGAPLPSTTMAIVEEPERGSSPSTHETPTTQTKLSAHFCFKTDKYSVTLTPISILNLNFIRGSAYTFSLRSSALCNHICWVDHGLILTLGSRLAPGSAIVQAAQFIVV